MTFRIISDIHLESCPNYLIAEMAGEEDQILLLAGDIYPYYRTLQGKRRDFFEDISRRFKEVVYIPGNHEYYFGDFAKGDDLLRTYFEDFPNIHFLNGDLVELDGVKIIGCTLWTEIDPTSAAHLGRFFSDYIAIKTGRDFLTPAQTVYLHREHKRFIAENADNNSVIITHHCPSYLSVHSKFKGDELNPFFYNNMDQLILDIQPKLWIHGHTHCSMNYKIGETRVLCNPKGYYNPHKYADPENIEFNEFLVF